MNITDDTQNAFYAGGSFYSVQDNSVQPWAPITVDVLENACGLEDVTGLAQNGADMTYGTDTEMYFRFSGFVPGKGRREFDFGLYGVTDTVIRKVSTLVDPVPGVTLSALPTNFLGPTEITLTASEAITGLSADSFETTNASVTIGGSAGANEVSLTVTPEGPGPVSVSLPAGAVRDSSSYPNTASNVVTGTALGADTVTAEIGTSADVLFKVPATLFLTGSASASNSGGSSAQDLADLITWSWSFGDGGTSRAQNPIHTYSQAGTYTIQLTACVYETCDSTSEQVEVVLVPSTMTPTLSGFSGDINGPQTVTVTFNAGVDAADPLGLDDFATTNLALSNLSVGSPLPAYDQVQSYTLTATPLADGPVALSLPAGKVANYGSVANAASNTLSGTRDTTAPVIVLDELMRPSLPMLQFIADFRHPTDAALPLAVAPVVSGAVLTGGPTVINPQVFSVTLVPQRDGEVSITFPAGALVDASGNASAETRTTLGTVDVDEPLPVISGFPSVVADPFEATITFSRMVEGFTSDDIQVTGGAVTGFGGSGTTYTATVTPDGSPEITLAIPAEVAQHVALPGAPGVFSTAATPVSSRFNTAPLADAGPDQVSAGGVLVTLDGSGSSDADDDGLSYLWTGPADITLSDATAVQPSFTAPSLATGDPDRVLSFTLTVNDGTETHSDSVQITLRADVGVTLSGLPDSFSGPGRHELAITFSRPVTGVEASDLQVTGGSVQSLSGSGASYLAVLEASGQGDLSVVLPAAMAVDGDGIP
ncbi:Ig-like domain-containing protein, partial [Oceanicola sp. S124]|uniref:Ig-like domain-containing protein n=1 Tax=Oceanicola sp. S124 TaxID=1042378 RepID=UPI00143A2B82